MTAKILEVDKNSHEKFRLSIAGNIVDLRLVKSDGHGGFVGTANSFAFNTKHIDKVRQLLDQLAAEQRGARS